MLLARLGVSTIWQGRGVGAGLLKDAMRRTMQAADTAGIRALVVHAKDGAASAFYRHFDFVPSPTDAHHPFSARERTTQSRQRPLSRTSDI